MRLLTPCIHHYVGVRLFGRIFCKVGKTVMNNVMAAV
jgi:hypothetical protein